MIWHQFPVFRPDFDSSPSHITEWPGFKASFPDSKADWARSHRIVSTSNSSAIWILCQRVWQGSLWFGSRSFGWQGYHCKILIWLLLPLTLCVGGIIRRRVLFFIAVELFLCYRSIDQQQEITNSGLKLVCRVYWCYQCYVLGGFRFQYWLLSNELPKKHQLIKKKTFELVTIKVHTFFINLNILHFHSFFSTISSQYHAVLGSFFLQREDVKSLGLWAIWNYSKVTGLPWFDMGHKGPVQSRPRCIGAQRPQTQMQIIQSINHAVYMSSLSVYQHQMLAPSKLIFLLLSSYTCCDSVWHVWTNPKWMCCLTCWLHLQNLIKNIILLYVYPLDLRLAMLVKIYILVSWLLILCSDGYQCLGGTFCFCIWGIRPQYKYLWQHSSSLTVWPWRWRQYDPLTRQELHTEWHNVTSQKNWIFRLFDDDGT